MSQKKGGHDGLMVRVDQSERVPGINFSNLILDHVLNPLLRHEKIALLTEFLEKPEYRHHKDSVKILRALEFLFAEDEIRGLNEKEAVLFRRYLIDLFYRIEKGHWGNFFPEDEIPEIERGFALKLLEKILEGWSWYTDYDTPSHMPKQSLRQDAASCFSFVCEVCRKEEKKNYSGTDFQKQIWEIFRKSVEYGWTFDELTSWILRAPEGIAVVLLKQRTRLGGKDLLPEIQLLERFDIRNRSEETIGFIARKMEAARKAEEFAIKLVEIMVSGEIGGIEGAEYGLLDEQTALVHVSIEVKKKAKQKADCLEVAKKIEERRDRFVAVSGEPYKILIKVTGQGFDYHDPELDSGK